MEKNNKAFKEVQLKIFCGPRLQKNLELQYEIHFALNRELANSCTENFREKVRKYIKIFSYLVLFSGIGIVFSSCAGYIATEPSYIEYSRPSRPGETHIWIDGGWRWDNHNHIYVQRHGYWEIPRQNRTFVEGHWKVTPRGKYWIKGHWQRHDRVQRYQNR